MSHDSEFSHSITMHPHVFQLQQYPNRPESARSMRNSTPTNTDKATTDAQVAETTAFEAATLLNDSHDPVTVRHVSSSRPDEEIARPPHYVRENDPFHLAAAYKSVDQIKQIRANSSQKRGPLGRTNEAWKARRIQGFYENQNENIERLLKPVSDHVADAKQFDKDNHLKFQIAVYGSFIANVILAILQIYGAVSSGSLSLYTTMADAIFDPLSNVTLIVTNRAVAKVDSRRFPSGKARLETIGNITFCFIMTAVSFILITFSIRELIESDHELNMFHVPSVVAVAVAFVTKLVLFLYCWALKDTYSQIKILWQDHRNDLFINGFGILTSVGGSKLTWWLDPAGAIILSLIISVIWLRTAFEEFLLLVGVSGPVDMHQLITYVCLTHSPDITGIDTVRCYHSGPRLIAEVDIVMDPDATLRDTHDVAEELQMKIESLPDVERAYVHVDYETTHRPEHSLKKDL